MISEMQEVKLSNSKLFLDIFKPEDFDEIEELVKATNDDCYFGDFLDNEELVERLNSRSILSNAEPSNILWTIRLRNSGESVGIAGLLPDAVNSNETQLVWFVCLERIPKKQAASVVHMLMEYAFNYNKLAGLSVYVPNGQKKHKSVARQIGLKFQKYLWKDNKPVEYYKLRP